MDAYCEDCQAWTVVGPRRICGFCGGRTVSLSPTMQTAIEANTMFHLTYPKAYA